MRNSLEDGVARLRSLGDLARHSIPKVVLDGNGDLGAEPIALDNLQDLAEGGAVRREGTRSDGVQSVTNDIRDREDQHLSRMGRSGRQTRLDLGNVLSHRVDLVDVGPGGQQLPRELDFLLQGDGRGG